MFGSSWKSKSSNQKQSRIDRSTHINSYLNDPTLKPSTRKVGYDSSTYDTVFQTKNGNALILRVHFRERDVVPMMTLVGIQATHPWIDNNMRVKGYLAIQSESAWLNSGLTLGKAVNTVVAHFQLHPPSNIQITDASLNQLQSRMQNAAQLRNSRPLSHNQPVHQFAAATKVVSDLPPPVGDVLAFTENDVVTHESIMSTMDIPSSVPTSFPEVDNMELTEINDLLQNKELFNEMMYQLPFVKTMEATKQSKSAEVQHTANVNLEKEEELKALYDEVENLQKSLKEKVSAYNRLQEKQKNLIKPADREETIKKLTIAKKQTYNESEDIASDWIEDGTDVKEFIKTFIEIRTVHHVRAAKIERVKNQ